MRVTLTSEPDRLTVQTGRIKRFEWDSLLDLFDDADLCQTWAYGAARWGSSRLGHLIVRQSGRVVGAAQIARIGPPVPRLGMAYVKWGPLWRRRGAESNVDILRHMVRALDQHYVKGQGLVLRVMPRAYGGQDEYVAKALAGAGLTPVTSSPVYRTIRLNLRSSLDELHRALRKSWRARLRKA